MLSTGAGKCSESIAAIGNREYMFIHMNIIYWPISVIYAPLLLGKGENYIDCMLLAYGPGLGPSPHPI